nr:DUF3795 domain-containing protein [Chloroflexota bacterium]
MERMIAMCGLDCGPCEARLATQANDTAAKERVAAQWREQFHAPDIDAAYVACDGCLASTDRHCGWCYQCPIRACGMERGLPNCAHCDEFESCEKLAGFFGPGTPARATLEAIRKELKT